MEIVWCWQIKETFVPFSLTLSPVDSDGGGHVDGAGHEGVGHRVEVGHGVGEHGGAVRPRERGQREQQEGAYQHLQRGYSMLQIIIDPYIHIRSNIPLM